MTQIRHAVYTDVSFRHHQMAYAAWVLRGSETLRRWTGTIGSERKTVNAEIMASCLACKQIRDGEAVVVYTDIDALIRYFNKGKWNGIWPGFDHLPDPIQKLKEESGRFSFFDIRPVHNSESPFYQWCHHSARKAAAHAKGRVAR